VNSPAYRAGVRIGQAVRDAIDKHGVPAEAMADLLRDLARKVTEQAARDDQQRK
jgi:hypothetical protein